MRVPNLLRDFEVDAASGAERGACPFTNSVGGEDGGIVERRRKIGARGVRDVVLAKENLAVEAERLANLAAYPQLRPEPGLQGADERAPRARVGRGVPGDDALELEQRFLIEDHVVELVRVDAARVQAEVRRLDGQSSVVFEAAEPLLFGRGHQVAVAQQAGAGVVVEAGQAEDIQVWFRLELAPQRFKRRV